MSSGLARQALQTFAFCYATSIAKASVARKAVMRLAATGFAPPVRHIHISQEGLKSALQRIRIIPALSSTSILGGVRHTTNGQAAGLKTRQAAAKRFIKTGKGKLKYKCAGLRHNNGHISSGRSRRLNAKRHLSGKNHKNMIRLLLTGK